MRILKGLLETASTNTTYNKRSYITVCYIRAFLKSGARERVLYSDIFDEGTI